MIAVVEPRPASLRAHAERFVAGVAVTVSETDDARDRELLRRVREGDPAGEAFRTLFGRNAGVAMAVAQRITHSELLAEEAVQEAFLQLWRAPEKHDATRGTVRRWLLTLVHARAVDLVRREQAQRRRTEVAAAEPVLALDPADDVVREVAQPAERAAVHAALDVLPADQRAVIELMYFQGISQTGIAERLDIPLGTVKSRSVLAMRKLRRAMVETDR